MSVKVLSFLILSALFLFGCNCPEDEEYFINCSNKLSSGIGDLFIYSNSELEVDTLLLTIENYTDCNSAERPHSFFCDAPVICNEIYQVKFSFTLDTGLDHIRYNGSIHINWGIQIYYLDNDSEIIELSINDTTYTDVYFIEDTNKSFCYHKKHGLLKYMIDGKEWSLIEVK